MRLVVLSLEHVAPTLKSVSMRCTARTRFSNIIVLAEMYDLIQNSQYLYAALVFLPNGAVTLLQSKCRRPSTAVTLP